jgi:hypothetical protein
MVFLVVNSQANIIWMALLMEIFYVSSKILLNFMKREVFVHERIVQHVNALTNLLI